MPIYLSDPYTKSVLSIKESLKSQTELRNMFRDSGISSEGELTKYGPRSYVLEYESHYYTDPCQIETNLLQNP